VGFITLIGTEAQLNITSDFFKCSFAATIGQIVSTKHPLLKLEDIYIRKTVYHGAFTLSTTQIEFAIENVDPFLSDKVMKMLTGKIFAGGMKIAGTPVVSQTLPHLPIGSVGDACSVKDPASGPNACGKGLECKCAGGGGRRRLNQGRNLLFGGLQYLCTCQVDKTPDPPAINCTAVLEGKYDPAYKWW